MAQAAGFSAAPASVTPPDLLAPPPRTKAEDIAYFFDASGGITICNVCRCVTAFLLIKKSTNVFLVRERCQSEPPPPNPRYTYTVQEIPPAPPYDITYTTLDTTPLAPRSYKVITTASRRRFILHCIFRPPPPLFSDLSKFIHVAQALPNSKVPCTDRKRSCGGLLGSWV
jgi:hypothetical protein